MTDKMFDCVFIATDSNGVNKVRFANGYEKRLSVFKRDNFIVSYSEQFDNVLTKQQILDNIDENMLSEQDFVAYQNAYKMINRANTDEQDVLNAIDSKVVFQNILARKETEQQDLIA